MLALATSLSVLHAQSTDRPARARARAAFLLHSCDVGTVRDAASWPMSADGEVAAWAVLCAVQVNGASGARLAALTAYTDTLVATRSADPWAWLAHTGALLAGPAHAAVVPAAVDTLLTLARGHADAEAAAALVLANHGLETEIAFAPAESLARVVAVLDQHVTAFQRRADRVAWLTLRGEALARLAAQRQSDSSRAAVGDLAAGHTMRPTDADTLARAATAAFVEARALAPGDPLPDYRMGLVALASRYMSSSGTVVPLADRFVALQRAVRLAPEALGVHRAFWEFGKQLSIEWRRRDPTRAQVVRAALVRDVATILARHPHDPATLAALAEYECSAEFQSVAMGCARLRAWVLRDFPMSDAAEAVLYYSWQALSDSATRRQYGPAPLRGPRRAAYLAMAHAYLMDAPHRNDYHLGEFAYWFTWAMYGDTVVATADLATLLHELVPLARGGVLHSQYVMAADLQHAVTLLADRHMALAEAARAARMALDAEWDAVARLIGQQGPHLADSVDELLTQDVGRYADALGWTLAQQGDLTEGTRMLRLSTALDSVTGTAWLAATPWYHLGELALREHDTATAMHDYQIALAHEATDMDWILPHEEAIVPMLPAESRIRALYTAMHHGDAAGVAEALAGDSVHARAALLATRLTSPEPLPRFRLARLDGRTVSSDSLRGKVVVINGWGIWCGWCVAELPAYQRLYERYKTDPDVVILAIDREEDSTLTADSVRAFVARRGWTFPVLMDADHYMDSARVNAFPSTVFVDRQGRVAFRKDGYSKYLEREFTWRIEALKREP